MEEELRALLRNTAAISQLVGDRVSHFDHPQGKGVPYITTLVVSGAEGLTMQGGNGLHEGRVQIDCYARTRVSAKTVAGAVIALLHAYRGGGFRVVKHVATRDSREGGTNEAERLFRVGLDFTTSWRVSP